MGSPALPTLGQIQSLIEASALQPAKTESVSHSITLAPQALAVLEITR
jgi:hypothetical protein